MTYQQNVAAPQRGITAGDAALWGAGALATYYMHRRHQHARAEVQARSAAYRADVAQRPGRHPAGDPGPTPAAERRCQAPDPVAALHERRVAANMRRPNPLVSNGWSQS